jgi:endo-1,4-beta-xylanase
MCGRYLGLCLILTVVFSVAPCFGEKDIITNGGFEKGTDGWTGRGCQIEAVSEPVHSGKGSVKASGRDSEWQGVTQSMLGKMKDGETYQISGWVRLEDPNSSGTVIVSVEQADDAGTNYINVGRATATSSEWTEVSGEFTLDVDGVLSTLEVYFEGPDPGVNFYVDDVKVVAADDDDDDEDMDNNDDEDDNGDD